MNRAMTHRFHKTQKYFHISKYLACKEEEALQSKITKKRIYIYIYIYIYMCVFVCVGVCLCLCVYVCVCVNIFIYIYYM